jgi:hypothetical protein
VGVIEKKKADNNYCHRLFLWWYCKEKKMMATFVTFFDGFATKKMTTNN